jgi:hypothetical protein
LMTENSPLFRSRQGAEALRGASATRNDIFLLQKAANRKRLSLTKACIWRISAERPARPHSLHIPRCHAAQGGENGKRQAIYVDGSP